MPEYIDRKSLGISKCNPDVFKDRAYAEGWNAAIEIIEKVPTEDVAKIVHSKWIKRNNERRCPICHYFYMTNGTTVYKFCPMCGAKMDGK